MGCSGFSSFGAPGTLGTMQIFVKSLKHTTTVDVSADCTPAQLKAAVENIEFIPAAMMRLVTGTRQLEGTAATLADFGLQDADSVTMLLDVSGGMRAKWRKKRMRRLRRKRR